MRRKWRRVVICSGLAAAGALSAWSLAASSFFQLVNLKAQDTHFLLRHWISPNAISIKNIVLLTIDKESLNTFPEVEMFWHPYYAEAIKASAAAGAKVMVLDVAFGVPVNKWEPDHDQMLVEAVSNTASVMPTICAYVPGATAWTVPINMLAPALGLSAWANLTVDPDDFIREQELIEKPDPQAAPGKPLERGMALRAAEKYLGEDAQFRDGRLFLKGREIPVARDRTIIINYAGRAGTVPRVSLAKFIETARAGNVAQLRNWVSGKIVLLGPDSIDDRHATPFFTLFTGKDWLTPGVEIHANTLNTILTGNYLLPAPPWLEAVSLLITTGLTVAVAVNTSPAWLALLGVLIFFATHLLFRGGTILPTAELLAAWLLTMVAGIVYRNATAEKKSAFFRKAVALFVGRQVARSLDESLHIGLTGKRQNVTILFTDIRGFTAFCEEKDPAVVVDLLNDYMGRMVSIIHTWHGHVNKFIGDGILAVFCDDDPDAVSGDHAIRATRCAIEMVTAPGDFKTGAGLHSGPVVIGNVGSAEKMEFTVLGDTVNLASRLESLNKEHKTKLLLSGSTCELLENQVQVEYLGSVAIRGKTLPMKIYTASALLEQGQQRIVAVVG
ncbi:MAG TPA: adenylate/guanylate cyclase domain-containing protein, partial [Bryobacteraceae bacterium]